MKKLLFISLFLLGSIVHADEYLSINGGTLLNSLNSNSSYYYIYRELPLNLKAAGITTTPAYYPSGWLKFKFYAPGGRYNYFVINVLPNSVVRAHVKYNHEDYATTQTINHQSPYSHYNELNTNWQSTSELLITDGFTFSINNSTSKGGWVYIDVVSDCIHYSCQYDIGSYTLRVSQESTIVNESAYATWKTATNFLTPGGDPSASAPQMNIVDLSALNTPTTRTINLDYVASASSASSSTSSSASSASTIITDPNTPANYGQNSMERVNSLSWNLKPKALDVNNDQTYYLYALFEAEIFYMGYNVNGEREKKGKKIWYVKESGTDVFKAIKYGDDLGHYEMNRIVNDNNTTRIQSIFVANNYASVDFKTFNPFTYSWSPYSPASTTAPYFMSTKFVAGHQMPYWNFELVANLNALAYHLEAFVRRRDPAPSTVKYYTGEFDGSGDGLLNLTAYVGYSLEPLSYEMIFQKIQNKEFHEIYGQTRERLYDVAPKSDTSDSKEVSLYQYGPANKTTIYATIKAKKEDVGKKGFIYVFFQ